VQTFSSEFRLGGNSDDDNSDATDNIGLVKGLSTERGEIRRQDYVARGRNRTGQAQSPLRVNRRSPFGQIGCPLLLRMCCKTFVETVLEP
jgi:hypothetical protein